MRRVALFVPCYIDQLYPKVAISTLELLEKAGVEVDYPLGQTCCGQPLGNTGYECELNDVAKRFIDLFSAYDALVSPSGSCVHFVKSHYSFIDQTEIVKHTRANTYELCDFLINVLNIKAVDASFPYKVGIHQSCHGLRGLNGGTPSEIMAEPYSNIRALLETIKDISLINPDRMDECCGFGGTFSIDESAVSIKMGQDRFADFEKNDVEYVTSTDMSCLMHLDGVMAKAKSKMQVIHVAEILNRSVSA